MKQFTRARDLSTAALLELVEQASRYQQTQSYPDLSGKILGTVFFNPSLRTKLSFEAAMARSGGTALTLSPGGGTWAFESEFGVRMDQNKPEHLKEAVRVMSRYVDALGVRSFASLKSLEQDEKEDVLSAFEEYATVPIVSLESAMEHPCQMLADMLTMRTLLEECQGRRFCLRWAPHIKPLPLAVPHSALLAAAHLGMEVSISAPEEYSVHPAYQTAVQAITKKLGTSVQFSHEPDALPDHTDVVYVKSWGAPSLYGSPEKQAEELRKLSPWMVKRPLLQRDMHLLHCLPVRRNVVIDDDALDDPRAKVIDQAENRLWAQLAVLNWIFDKE